MPIAAPALSAIIKAKLLAVPIGNGPISTAIKSTPAPDGTATVSAVPAPGPIFMDKTLAQVIADAVAEGVVTHLLTAAIVVNPPPSTPGKIT